MDIDTQIFVLGAGLTNRVREVLRAIEVPSALFLYVCIGVHEKVPFQFQTAHATHTVNMLKASSPVKYLIHI